MAKAKFRQWKVNLRGIQKKRWFKMFHEYKSVINLKIMDNIRCFKGAIGGKSYS